MKMRKLNLACSLPSSTAESVAAAILTCSESSLRAQVTKRVPHHQRRDLALAFVDRWRCDAKEVDAQTVGIVSVTCRVSGAELRELQHEQQCYRCARCMTLTNWLALDSSKIG